MGLEDGQARDSGQAKDTQAATRIAVVAVGIAVATALHYLTSPSLILWHNLFQRLYYLPIIYAAIYFGWRGGLAASTVSALCYIPHILMTWHHMPDYAVNQYAEIIVFFLVGTTTGVLADRGRKQRVALESASAQLARVNRELQDSFEQVRRADRLSAIGQLAASLAHEIRNPLASIDGAANLIESPQTPDDVRTGSIAVIHKETQRLNRLLTNLLDFARPRKPQFQAVEAGPLIDAVMSLLEHSAKQKEISLRKQIAPALPAFEGDPEQMKQVILNLAINAIQAMDAPGEVIFSARQKDDSVMVSVRDHGIGVADEHLDRIFDPFFTTKEAGTGLGLSVVHQIVTRHGGAVTTERNPEGGMTFSLLLPLRVRSTH
ncbi:MAG TPA: ATP-binding protein [Bryobacteraceae bacterium]|nr:ATP-binding protein [Bryobacteraceae bacterium]